MRLSFILKLSFLRALINKKMSSKKINAQQYFVYFIFSAKQPLEVISLPPKIILRFINAEEVGPYKQALGRRIFIAVTDMKNNATT